MTGTKNPSRKYFKRNQPYFYKSVDNWEEWDTDESYDRTFFIGIDDIDPEDIDVALYMIWGGKAMAVVSDRVLNTVSDVVDTAKLLEEEIQSILEEVQEITVALAQAKIDIEEAITEMNALIDRCEGILDGAEAARDLAQAWATKMDGMVEEDGQPVDYSAKYYANEAKNSETAASTSATTASASATTATEQATAASTSAEQAATSASTAASYASTAHIDASGAATSAANAANSATASANSATASANSASASATSAQEAQDALDEVHGLIAMPIGAIFQSVYVDESLDMARQLNGQLISSTKFTGFRTWLNKVQTAIPNLFTTETNWQAEKALSKFGQVGKFVIDDTAGTIRLPAVVNPQGLLGLSGIGNLVNESLPNFQGTFQSNLQPGQTNRAALTWNQPATGTAGITPLNTNPFAANAQGINVTGGCNGFSINLSQYNNTYQDNAPVQQEAIQYPYYIQVATGIEETLPAVREYELNNPFFFGQSMYSENAPYNASWLASNGQYNSNSVYPDMYTQLNSVELNGSLNVGDTIEISGKTYVKRGLPVKLSTDTYDDYDFVVNTADQTFRLPLLNGEEDLPSGRHDILNYVSGQTYTSTANGWFSCYGSATDATASYNLLINQTSGERDTKYSTSANRRLDVSLEVSKGQSVLAMSQNLALEDFRFIYAKGNGTLYYYVGDTVQDASLINAGAVLGQLATKTNFVEAAAASMPSDQYINLTLGASGSTYIAPANGYFCVIANGLTYLDIYTFSNGPGLNTKNSTARYLRVFAPVKKGANAVVSYVGTPSGTVFRFYYAEGNQ